MSEFIDFIRHQTEIETFLREYCTITGGVVIEDGLVSIDGDCMVFAVNDVFPYSQLPVEFKHVSGQFALSLTETCILDSLIGSPLTCARFSVNDTDVQSLDGIPEQAQQYYISGCESLRYVENLNIQGGSFCITSCTSLEKLSFADTSACHSITLADCYSLNTYSPPNGVQYLYLDMAGLTKLPASALPQKLLSLTNGTDDYVELDAVAVRQALMYRMDIDVDDEHDTYTLIHEFYQTGDFLAASYGYEEFFGEPLIPFDVPPILVDVPAGLDV